MSGGSDNRVLVRSQRLTAPFVRKVIPSSPVSAQCVSHGSVVRKLGLFEFKDEESSYEKIEFKWVVPGLDHGAALA
jgi:hypothetical protein